MDTHTRYRFPLAVALLAAFWQTAQASDENEIYRLITPESTVSSFGVGYQGDNNAQYFGEYNGMNQRGAFGLLDALIVKRDNETGTWYKFTTRNLGLEDRDIRWEQERQGNWGYSIDYSEIPRYNPFIVTTGLGGISTGTSASTQTINGVPLRPVQLETERKRFTIDLNKFLPAGYDFKVRYIHEDKTGSRMFGQGNDTPINFLAEPIDWTTQQAEAVLNYTGEDLQLSGGYYGTWFYNNNPALNVIGGIANLTPMALPPGNQSNQANLSGGYNFSPTTRGNFKAAYTRQLQSQAFIIPAAPGTSNLQGRVDTYLAQAGLTSQITNKLSMLADARYENRDDQTPIYNYFFPPSNTQDGTNEPRSIRTYDGKLQASYVLPMGFRFTGGGEYIVKSRNEFDVRSVSFRSKTYEMNYLGELRRAISETVTGAVSYVHSDRWGSPFLTNENTATPPVVGSNNIAPLFLSNRTADTVKVSSNWTPTEKLSFQAFGSGGWVDYGSRNNLVNNQSLGLSSGQTLNFSADATYVFTEKWQANAWYSYNDIRVSQATCAGVTALTALGPSRCPNTATNPSWGAWLQNVSNSFGIGTKGKINSKLEIGADAEYSHIADYYPMASLSPISATDGSAAPIYTHIFDLKLNAKYALQKNMGFRFNYIYNHFKTNDWTWTTWKYSDGTTVTQNPNQVVNFFGLAYYLTWQ
jgi:MtrB/PioB family decaheme-associated outer membrane protein